MLIEALARLTLVHEECKDSGIVVNSPMFMKETEDVIKSQLDLVKKDIKFQQEDPGPYTFGIGKRSLIVFPPIYTETSDWAMIVFNEETQVKEQIFVFQTLYGFVENLANAFKYIQNVSSIEQNSESTPETGSVQGDSAADSNP